MRKGFALFLLLLVLLIGCGRAGASAGPAVQVQVVGTPATRPTPPPSAPTAPQAPDFTVPTLEGGTFSLAEHRGRPVLLYFMADGCVSCLPEAEALARLHEEVGDRVTIVALDLDPGATPSALARFRALAGNGAYVWAFDREARVAQAYAVRTLDTTILIDPEGRIVYRDAVPTPYGQLAAVVQPFLEEDRP